MIRKPMIVILVFLFLIGSVCSSLGVQNETGRATLSDSNFQDGSPNLGPEGAKVLQKILTALKADPNMGLRIEGYSDNQGATAETTRLAQQRARAVSSWFVKHGIDSDRLEATAVVDSPPTGDNATAAGQALNRRVEIVTVALKTPTVFFPETRYTFDPVVDGVYVTYDFVVHNKGDGLLKIKRVRTG